MTVVLDTNVIFSAIASPHGASFAIVSSLPSKKFTTAISLPYIKSMKMWFIAPER